jgi:hypothetical protein
MIRMIVVLGTVLLTTVASTASSTQTKSPAIVVQVGLQVAGAAYAASGPGECVHTTDASLFDVPGAMWGIRTRDRDRDVNFTFWRLSKGGEMLTVWVTTGGKTHRVNTLQVGPSTERRGSGKATFEKRAAGGVFTLDLLADTGAKITGQLTCSAFVAPEANGN